MANMGGLERQPEGTGSLRCPCVLSAAFFQIMLLALTVRQPLMYVPQVRFDVSSWIFV
jgi:hypothetical protein